MMSASDTPASLAPQVTTVSEYLGLAWLDPSIPSVLERAESVVRQRCSEVVALWPATAGLRPSIKRLARRAAALVDGPTSRLARALANGTPRSLQLGEGPLMRALRACASLDAQIHAVCEAARLVAAVNEMFDRLEGEFAVDVPRAWRHWTEAHGVSRLAIASAQSAEELNSIARWLERVERELGVWRTEIHSWLSSSAAMLADEPADERTPTAALEYRYEILLKIGAADREPSQQGSATRIRDTVKSHLQRLAADAVVGRDDAMVRIAQDFAIGQYGAPMTSDEIGTYLLALDHYSVSWRRARRPVQAGA